MKLRSTPKKLKTILAMCMGAGLLMAQPAFASGKPYKRFIIENPGEEKPVKKNKNKTAKEFSSRNNSSIKIYPDAVKRDMHVVAKDNEGKTIDFFVFDLQGELVQHYKMKGKDHNKMTGLNRGTYVYRVFCGDEETATGKFDIR
ncbi:MAG: T9SS type A sorting domain-containing protein [Chitinophagaceae bacterium]